MIKRLKVLTALGVVAIVTVVVGFVYKIHEPGEVANSAKQSQKPLYSSAALKALEAKNASSADLSHVAQDVMPPTNSWISGMVLQKTPLAVYPLPLSFLAQNSGFEIGLPNITSTEKTILGEHVAGSQAEIPGAEGFTLSRYDKVSATITYHARDARILADVTLAEGSPYVFYSAKTDGSLNLGSVPASAIQSQTPQYIRYTRLGHDYVIVAGKGATIVLSQNGTISVKTAASSLVTLYTLDSGAKDSLQQYAGNQLTAVTVSHHEDGTKILTSYDYATVNNKPTVYSALPYQMVVSANSSPTSSAVLENYESVYGQMKAVAGNTYTIMAPTVTLSNQLDTSKLTSDQKTQLIATLAADSSATIIDKTDTYFAGKQLARAANLLELAEQLKQPVIADKLKAKLQSAFDTKFKVGNFYYDSGLKGVAATNKSFGSEDFNDHHFHYGYFIYAAGILSKYDPTFLKNHNEQINLLVADIASYDQGTDFPVERNYDPYAGHSWAAGLAPFSDGNNQESSSEAVQAWNAVGIWGSVTSNDQLRQSAVWMLANEAQAAQSAWRVPVLASGNLQKYTSPIISLNFGGKRVYSTFFSDEPSAKLGIQLIPLNPAMVSFRTDGSNIVRNVSASITNSNFNVPLGDYVLMYLGLSQPAKAIEIAGRQQDAFIDDGNSRSYLLAWLYTQAQR